MFRNESDKQVAKKLKYSVFIGVFPRNLEIIFQKFWENSWDILN